MATTKSRSAPGVGPRGILDVLMAPLFSVDRDYRYNAFNAAHADGECVELRLETARLRAEAAAARSDAVRDAEESQARLAAELHDTVVQTLVGARLLLEDVAEDPDVPARLAVRAHDAVSSVADAMVSTLRIMRGLSPLTFEAGTAVRLALEGAGRTAEEADLRLTSSLPEDCSRISEEAAIMLYWLVREAVINVARHADASLVDVRVESGDDGTRLTVTDDGVGVDSIPVRPAGFGIAGMRARVEEVGGTLEIGRAVPKGTRVSAWLPAAEGGSPR